MGACRQKQDKKRSQHFVWFSGDANKRNECSEEIMLPIAVDLPLTKEIDAPMGCLG
ncbi:hypothetical protein [Dechloromonas sp. ARDL1]|uniref:hypothetical protein n=1 Tax=Dechloromonas sp. ARDL1 TaxID=3322121 RepID=UPI003DA71F70